MSTGSGDGKTSRRRPLGGAAAMLAAIGGLGRPNAAAGGRAPMVGAAGRGKQGATPAAAAGRLLARPGEPTGSIMAGLHPLGLNDARDALLLVPAGYRPDRPAPFVLSLHGAGGDAEGGLYPLRALADEAGVILLSPPSRGVTWDVLRGGFGPDVAFLDQALTAAFARCAVDPERLAIAGFSDGASYALSLGLTNGDLFRQILAFSPGFAAPAERRGTPRIFVSHGTGDEILPIDPTSRRVVPRLEQAGYDVTAVEFDGGHSVPPVIARRALDLFLDPRSASPIAGHS